MNQIKITIGDTISFSYKGDDYLSVISNNQNNDLGVQIYVDNYGQTFVKLEELKEIVLREEGPWHAFLCIVIPNYNSKNYFAERDEK